MTKDKVIGIEIQRWLQSDYDSRTYDQVVADANELVAANV